MMTIEFHIKFYIILYPLKTNKQTKKYQMIYEIRLIPAAFFFEFILKNFTFIFQGQAKFCKY